MRLRDTWDAWDDSLVWRIPMLGHASGLVDGPGFDPPTPWAQALAAVGRDLRCLRFGRYVDTDRLVWDMVINSDYYVSIGWQSVRGLGGFRIGAGLTMDATFGEASAWTAEVVQDNLAGYEFVQWPCRGRYLLVPRLHATESVWVDPHGDVTISPIGKLCEHADRWLDTPSTPESAEGARTKRGHDLL